MYHLKPVSSDRIAWIKETERSRFLRAVFRRISRCNDVSRRKENLREPWYAGPRTMFAAPRTGRGMLAGERAKQYGANET
ncbi:hypothetical protein [Burkholderia sp. MSMB1078WGS]|uniref:hypothetical protein n=1 Tax=Burkholderia sp. MSMB1078WGS TaxID=1637900 RepID=UPI0012E3BBC3|nr:hypothetical protein [Burkholderia sp. MSMB1078WGS]